MRLIASQTSLVLSLVASAAGLFAGCDTGDVSCGPGTVAQNGQCVAAGPDTSGGTDTATSGGTDTATTDTGSGRDTTTTDTASADDTAGADTASGSNACTTDEAGSRDFGAPCSKNCQCRTDVGGYCYSGPFLEGFSFCSRNGGGSGLSSDTYPTGMYNSACWGFPRAEWPTPMTKSCNTLDDCKALSDAYTHCGTGGFAWDNGGRDTQCPNRPDYDDPNGKTTLFGKKVCIISTLPPFNRRP